MSGAAIVAVRGAGLLLTVPAAVAALIRDEAARRGVDADALATRVLALIFGPDQLLPAVLGDGE